jgi:hypothetical protein
MALFSRSPEFVLTFRMVDWIPSSLRTGSLDSGRWGIHEALALRRAKRAPNLPSDFAENGGAFPIGMSRNGSVARPRVPSYECREFLGQQFTYTFSQEPKEFRTSPKLRFRRRKSFLWARMLLHRIRGEITVGRRDRLRGSRVTSGGR